MRVLVADDQEVTRLLIAAVLTDAGHEVVGTAADGREAFLQARELRPDAVVLDLGMPTLDGVATLRLLHDVDPALRIVVHTGYDDDELSTELAAAGSAAVIVKSGDPAPLLAAMARVG